MIVHTRPALELLSSPASWLENVFDSNRWFWFPHEQGIRQCEVADDVARSLLDQGLMDFKISRSDGSKLYWITNKGRDALASLS